MASLWKNILSIVVILIFCLLAYGSSDTTTNRSSSSSSSTKKEEKPKTKEELRQERIERHFSLWDGSHNGLEKIIKESMNDPDSYDHVETVYWDKGDYLIVKTTFRGKNAFGGVVKNWIKAKTDLDGNVLSLIEQELMSRVV